MSNFIQSIKKNLQFWYVGYGFQGFVGYGTAILLLPILVNRQFGLTASGIVVASFYLGQTLTPIFGWLADKFKCYKLIYWLGYLLIGFGMFNIPWVVQLWYWIFLAFAVGLGIGANKTAADLFIIGFSPKEQWNARLGLLDTLYGLGQTFGLLAVVWLSHQLSTGFFISGVVALIGLFLGSIHLPNTKNSPTTDKALQLIKQNKSHIPAGHLSGLSRVASFAMIGKLFLGQLENPFTVFILAWLMLVFNNTLIYNLLPLLMHNAYHLSSATTSMYFAIGAGVGVFIYFISGLVGQKFGNIPVLITAVSLCTLCVLGMTFCAIFPSSLNTVLVPLFFIPIPILWSPLLVTSSAVAPRLTKISQGDSIGIYNATYAIGNIISALLAGFIAHILSFVFVLGLAVLCGVVSVILFFFVKRLTSSTLSP